MKQYQARLRAFVRASQGDDSLRGLAERMGSIRLKSRIWHWLNRPILRPLHDDSYQLLARVDPQGRTPREIERYLLGEGERVLDVKEAALEMLTLKIALAMPWVAFGGR